MPTQKVCGRKDIYYMFALLLERMVKHVRKTIKKFWGRIGPFEAGYENEKVKSVIDVSPNHVIMLIDDHDYVQLFLINKQNDVQICRQKPKTNELTCKVL